MNWIFDQMDAVFDWVLDNPVEAIALLFNVTGLCWNITGAYLASYLVWLVGNPLMIYVGYRRRMPGVVVLFTIYTLVTTVGLVRLLAP